MTGPTAKRCTPSSRRLPAPDRARHTGNPGDARAGPPRGEGRRSRWPARFARPRTATNRQVLSGRPGGCSRSRVGGRMRTRCRGGRSRPPVQSPRRTPNDRAGSRHHHQAQVRGSVPRATEHQHPEGAEPALGHQTVNSKSGPPAPRPRKINPRTNPHREHDQPPAGSPNGIAYAEATAGRPSRTGNGRRPHRAALEPDRHRRPRRAELSWPGRRGPSCRAGYSAGSRTRRETRRRAGRRRAKVAGCRPERGAHSRGSPCRRVVRARPGSGRFSRGTSAAPVLTGRAGLGAAAGQPASRPGAMGRFSITSVGARRGCWMLL